MKKHAMEYPGLTAKEYEQRGLELVASPVSGDIVGYVAKNGNVVRYNRKTMDLAVGHPERGLKTLHKLGENPDKAYKDYLRDKRSNEKHEP